MSARSTAIANNQTVLTNQTSTLCITRNNNMHDQDTRQSKGSNGNAKAQKDSINDVKKKEVGRETSFGHGAFTGAVADGALKKGKVTTDGKLKAYQFKELNTALEVYVSEKEYSEIMTMVSQWQTIKDKEFLKAVKADRTQWTSTEKSTSAPRRSPTGYRRQELSTMI